MHPLSRTYVISQDSLVISRHGMTSWCMSRIVGNWDDNEMWRVADDGTYTRR